MLQNDSVPYSVIRYMLWWMICNDKYKIWCDLIWYMIWYIMWCAIDMMWFDVMWCDMTWYHNIIYYHIIYDMISYNIIWYDICHKIEKISQNQHVFVEFDTKHSRAWPGAIRDRAVLSNHGVWKIIGTTPVCVCSCSGARVCNGPAYP